MIMTTALMMRLSKHSSMRTGLHDAHRDRTTDDVQSLEKHTGPLLMYKTTLAQSVRALQPPSLLHHSLPASLASPHMCCIHLELLFNAAWYVVAPITSFQPTCLLTWPPTGQCAIMPGPQTGLDKPVLPHDCCLLDAANKHTPVPCTQQTTPNHETQSCPSPTTTQLLPYTPCGCRQPLLADS